MASKVSIANKALIQLGTSTITSLTQDVDSARKINAIFDDSLDYLLQLHNWNFATFRTTLARLSETPTYEYDYYYQLPSSPYCLQVVSVYNNPEYRIENRKLATDEDTVKIEYIGRITDMNELSPLFREAFSLYLAIVMNEPITGTGRIKNDVFVQFEKMLKLAKLRDAQESSKKTGDEEKLNWYNARS